MIYRPTALEYVRALALRDYGTIERAAVPVGSTGGADYSALAGLEGGREFRTAVARRLLPANVPSAWRLPFDLAVSIDTAGSVGYWFEPGGAIPVSAFAAAAVKLPVRQVGALVAVSKELLRATGAEADAALVRILARGVAKAVNATFLGAAAAADGAPAGIANGVTPIDSTGSDAADLAALVDAADAADVDLAEAVWFMSPARAAGIALSLGLPKLGVTGGELLGAPVRTDPAAGDRVFLAAGDRLAVAVGGVDVDSSENAALQLDNEPTNDSVTPTATNLVSMFQTDSVAIRAVATVNWIATAGAVFVLAGGDES